MKSTNPEKEQIIRIVNQLLDRSGLNIEQVVARMQINECDITRSMFENRFTTRVHQKPNIPAKWLLSLVEAFTHNLSNNERCRAEEAIELAKLARLPIDLLAELDRFFPKPEFSASIENYVPLLYARMSQNTTLGAETLTKKLEFRQTNSGQSSTKPLIPLKQEDWGEAPDTQNFNGRQTELVTLRHWIEQEDCRAVGIFGMSGIGKTMLATKLANDLRYTFAALCWRSIHNAPPLIDFIGDCLTCLTPLSFGALPATVEKRQSLLIQTLREQRCLLVIDSFETVMEEGNSAGGYRLGYENYAQFLWRIAESPHESCIILTSQEKPVEFAGLEGDGLPVRALTLGGINTADTQQLLHSKRLKGNKEEWERFCNRYSGNPLALKLAADAIRELFTGDIKAFLATDTTLFHNIRELLDQQFSRLTVLERELLYWLGIEREMVTLQILQTNLAYTIPQVHLLEALRSLRRRSLIEHNQTGFGLSNVVLHYITERLVKLFVVEVEAEMPIMLTSFALLKTQTKEYLRDTQVRLILLPVLEQLRHTLADEEITTKIWRMLHRLQAQATEVHNSSALPAAPPTSKQNAPQHGSWSYLPPENYCAGNLLNLLVYLPADLSNCDLSQLYIRQAQLHNVILQNVNFTRSVFRNTVFLETFGSISTVAFSPNGAHLAAGMTNGEINLWQLASDAPPLKLQGHTDMVWSVAFHPDGNRLASSSEDQTIRLWDVISGECLFSIHAHNGWVKSVCFNHAGTQLASGGHDALVRLWDSATGYPQLGWVAHEGWVWAIAYSPDDRLLATAGQDHLVKLWDAATGECLHTLQGHNAPVRALAFSPNGRYLASGSFDHSIKIWEIAAGTCTHTLCGHGNLIWSVAFSPDGTLLASSADDQSVRLWEVATGQLRNLLQGHHNRVWSVAFHPNGESLASGGDDQTLRFWDIASGHLVRKQKGYTNQVWSIAFARDQQRSKQGSKQENGRLMASGGDDCIVRLWNIDKGHCTLLLQGHTERIRTVTFSTDGRLLASGSDDCTIRLWHVQRGSCSQILTGHTNRVWSVAFHADGHTLASASEDQTVRLWNVETGRTLRTLRDAPGRIWSIAFHPWTPLLAGGTDATGIYLWDTETGEQIQSWHGHQSRIWTVSFSPDGRWLASGSADRTVRLWEVASGRCRYVLEAHSDAVWSVSFSPDGQWLASGGDDQRICIWSVEHGALVHTLAGHQGCIWTLAFAANDLLASGGQDETIRLWDGVNGIWQQTLRSERPYERMNITGIKGLTEAQKSSLRALGAIEKD